MTMTDKSGVQDSLQSIQEKNENITFRVLTKVKTGAMITA